MDNKSYIAHYGIPGMKWGVRRSLEELGHKLKARKTRKKRLNALKKARKARTKAKKAKEKFEKNKEKYMKDPVLMNKHKSMFTTDEINKATQRFQAEQNLHNATVSKINRPKTYMDSTVSYVNTAMNMYDAYSRVAKLFKKPVPEVPSRVRKEAQTILNKYKDTPFDEIPDLSNDTKKLANLSAIEGYTSGNKNKK